MLGLFFKKIAEDLLEVLCAFPNDLVLQVGSGLIEIFLSAEPNQVANAPLAVALKVDQLETAVFRHLGVDLVHAQANLAVVTRLLLRHDQEVSYVRILAADGVRNSNVRWRVWNVGRRSKRWNHDRGQDTENHDDDEDLNNRESLALHFQLLVKDRCFVQAVTYFHRVISVAIV